MTRREFFKLSFAALTALSTAPVLPVLASENTKHVISQPSIQETHLAFSKTLDNQSFDFTSCWRNESRSFSFRNSSMAFAEWLGWYRVSLRHS